MIQMVGGFAGDGVLRKAIFEPSGDHVGELTYGPGFSSVGAFAKTVLR